MSTSFSAAVDAVERASTPGGAARRAALLVHGMADADQAWLLEQLSEAQRETILPLIADLRAMQVPADARWGQQALSSSESQQASGLADARVRVAAASPATMFGLLTAEAPALVDCLLDLGPWPWEGEVMLMLRNRRGAVFAADRASGRQPIHRLNSADRALLEEVVKRLPNEASALGSGGRRAQRLQAFMRPLADVIRARWAHGVGA